MTKPVVSAVPFMLPLSPSNVHTPAHNRGSARTAQTHLWHSLCFIMFVEVFQMRTVCVWAQICFIKLTRTTGLFLVRHVWCGIYPKTAEVLNLPRNFPDETNPPTDSGEPAFDLTTKQTLQNNFFPWLTPILMNIQHQTQQGKALQVNFDLFCWVYHCKLLWLLLFWKQFIVCCAMDIFKQHLCS